MGEIKERKVDAVLVALGAMASEHVGDNVGPRTRALARILDKYGLRTVETDTGEIPWGKAIYETLRTWELLKAGKDVGPERTLGLVLKPEKVMTLDEALRRLGLIRGLFGHVKTRGI